MKKLILASGILFFLASSLNAYEDNYYNHRKGSNSVNGYNYNTGSSWSTTYESNGNRQGVDSHGNSWQYNQNTGNYYNYGTGKSCTGHGANRICTK